MHAAAWHCGYPAESSDSATGAVCEVTSTPSSHSLRLTPGLVPAGEQDRPGVAGECN